MSVKSLLPSVLSVLLLSAPAKAATLSSWHFDPTQNLLDIITDENVQPQAQLVANPTRLVIDLPGIELGHPRVNYPVGTLIKAIRVGQFNAGTTRLVIELAPGYTLDPNQVKFRGRSPTHWSVQLPMPQPLPDGFRSDAQPPDIALTTPPPLRSPLPAVAPTPTPDPTLARVIQLGSPMSDLQPQVQAVIQRYQSLKAGMYFVDLQTGNYLDIQGDRVFPAASTIKLPILIAFFQDVDAGKVSLHETLVMRRDLIASGSGDMQDMPVGSKFSALETVNKMITISDNTATNLIIDRLGGIERLNQRFRSWGLQDTVMHNWLGDFQGTNKTSSKDLVRLLALMINGRLVSDSSQEQVLRILRHTTVKTLLPSGLGPGAVIADKTGDIGFLVGDAGVIDMPNGRRYLAGIFVLRPYNDPIVRRFVREISHLVYAYLE
ncbi:beta-lactamase [Neosynechococcus sphagnicola sy1]|uniref:Beta-lactamase n=1 Tax=Neosynechococcus sphagnicola sy1 TaxID=1497020 RepID=A0A098THL1_9CYAN|nr:beta-lactamase [Neosynechococcus sphagnicola sy1]